MKGKGSGWKNESRRHSLARKGVKTVLPDGRRFDVSKFVANGNKLPEIDISRHNWSMKINPDGTMKLSLGNFSDAGWYWNGDESDLAIFLYRMMNSAVKDQFIEDIEEEGITFQMLVPQLIESMESPDGNGIYSLTGDNVRWHFGETFDQDIDVELDYVQEEYGLTDAEVNDLQETFWINETGDYVDYDLFEKSELYDDIKSRFLHEIKTSDDFNDFADNMKEFKEDVLFEMADYDSNIFYSDFNKIFHDWYEEKKKGKSMKHPDKTKGDGMNE
jgi:hypothetical protein